MFFVPKEFTSNFVHEFAIRYENSVGLSNANLKVIMDPFKAYKGQFVGAFPRLFLRKCYVNDTQEESCLIHTQKLLCNEVS